MEVKVYTLLHAENNPKTKNTHGGLQVTGEIFATYDEAANKMDIDFKFMKTLCEGTAADRVLTSSLEGNHASISFESSAGRFSFLWVINEYILSVPLGINTKLGFLDVKVNSGDLDHPGITVSANIEGQTIDLALVEYCADEADIPDPKIITRVWGDALEEDYTDRIIHRLPFFEDWTYITGKEKNSGTVDDLVSFVYCAQCGSYMLVRSHTSKCPKCGNNDLDCIDTGLKGIPFPDVMNEMTRRGFFYKKAVLPNGWCVITYDRDGNSKATFVKNSELECARLCVAQMKMGYPAPTVWYNNVRIEGY